VKIIIISDKEMMAKGEDMSQSENMILVDSRERPYLDAYNGFHNIEGKFLLGNGILINDQAEIIWNHPWEHGYGAAKYLKEQDVILTDRISNHGMGYPNYFGNGCIDFKTGHYLWKNWYTDDWQEMVALSKRKPDINLLTHFDSIEENGEWIWSRNFRVHIKNGMVENHQSLQNRPLSLKNLPEDLPQIHSYLENAENHPVIQFGISEVTLDQKTYSKEGYFFTKCHSVIEKDDFLYFFGIPAKRNPNGTLLFKYSLKNKEIVKEIEFPSRCHIRGVYDFFGKGFLIYEENYGKKWLQRLWHIKNELL
jgi:hypothetical protein